MAMFKKADNVYVIGPTLVFKGELSADEDLIIEGQIEGTIAHHKMNLTVANKAGSRQTSMPPRSSSKDNLSATSEVTGLSRWPRAPKSRAIFSAPVSSWRTARGSKEKSTWENRPR